ncbi:hypothetical protein [Methanobacterium sp. MBAC-LM]|uniref:hypothetical protein n=1 Tax=Methanobacterium sp. MBAC-LM TaxID=3412034 RepID=UPI003C771ED9
MGFTNRWVCQTGEEMDLGVIKQTLEEHFGARTGKEHELRSIVTIDSEIETQDCKFIGGKLHYQAEEDITDYEITELKTLKRVPKTVRRTYYIDFWISSNGLILFGKSGDKNKIINDGKEILSQIIFGNNNSINKITFDIKKIEEDALAGKHEGMWTFSFDGRLGNISKGTAFGEEVHEDPIYGQFRSAPKKFIGVKKEVDGNEIKVAIFEGGTFRIHTDLADSVYIPQVFESIEEFLEYAI